jgi:Glycosyltransferase (GlcNAc)
VGPYVGEGQLALVLGLCASGWHDVGMGATRVGNRDARRRDSPEGTRDTIFVSIAAYRDPELAATIEDCLAKARWPDRLRFGVCWQHGPDEHPLERFADPRFRVLDVDWRESRGPCWARSRIMRLFRDERWYLQLDSHHRFAPDWDAKLLAQAAATGSPRPIVSTYPGGFDPLDPGELSDVPVRMELGGFSRDGLVVMWGGAIADWQNSAAPRRARFLAAGFLFAPGRFVSDVRYDPYLYFYGEEITLAVRAFTHGYDLFHPGEAILWHEYGRLYLPHHWADHLDAHGVDVDWSKRAARGRRRARRLLTEPWPGRWGIGTARSLADYEAYAGISFTHRRIQEHTRRHLEPPNPPAEADWMLAGGQHHTVRITLPTSRLPEAAWKGPHSWYVGVYDWPEHNGRLVTGIGEELFRGDAEEQEVAGLLAGAPGSVTLVRQFQSAATPTAWMVHPYSTADGWLDPPIRGKLFEHGPGRWKGTPVEEPPDAAHDHRSARAAALRRDAEVFDRRPRATPGLRVSETEDGFSLSAPGRETPLLINSTGVLVLALANGRHSVSEIIDVVQRAFALEAPPEAEVLAFLDSALLCALVRRGTVPAKPRPTRRPTRDSSKARGST